MVIEQRATIHARRSLRLAISAMETSKFTPCATAASIFGEFFFLSIGFASFDHGRSFGSGFSAAIALGSDVVGAFFASGAGGIGAAVTLSTINSIPSTVTDKPCFA